MVAALISTVVVVIIYQQTSVYQMAQSKTLSYKLLVIEPQFLESPIGGSQNRHDGSSFDG